MLGPLGYESPSKGRESGLERKLEKGLEYEERENDTNVSRQKPRILYGLGFEKTT